MTDFDPMTRRLLGADAPALPAGLSGRVWRAYADGLDRDALLARLHGSHEGIEADLTPHAMSEAFGTAPRPSRVARLLGNLVGTDWSVVQSRPAMAQQVALGAGLVVSAGVKAVAFSLALVHMAGVSNYLVAATGGIAAALAFASVDRYMLATARASALVTRVVRLVPRVLLATLFAAAVSEALVLSVFSNEIDSRAEATAAARSAKAVSALRTESAEQAQIQLVESEVTMLRAELGEVAQEESLAFERVRVAEQALVDEAQGTGGTGLAGRGAAYSALVAELAAARTDLAEVQESSRSRRDALRSRMVDASTKIESLRDRLDAKVQEVTRRIDANEVGVLDRLTALEELNDEADVATARLLLLALLIALDVMPLLMKLQQPSLYDRLVTERERRSEQWVVEELEHQLRRRRVSLSVSSEGHELRVRAHLADEIERLSALAATQRAMLATVGCGDASDHDVVPSTGVGPAPYGRVER